jgi:hypothetical protein
MLTITEPGPTLTYGLMPDKRFYTLFSMSADRVYELVVSTNLPEWKPWKTFTNNPPGTVHFEITPGPVTEPVWLLRVTEQR